MRQLDGTVLMLEAGSSQLGRGESIADTARVLSRMVDAIMLRTDDNAKIEEMARHATGPVINGLTDRSHPCKSWRWSRIGSTRILCRWRSPMLCFSIVFPRISETRSRRKFSKDRSRSFSMRRRIKSTLKNRSRFGASDCPLADRRFTTTHRVFQTTSRITIYVA